MDVPPASQQDPPQAPAAAPSSTLIVLVSEAWNDPGHRAAVVGGGACLGLLAATFWPTLRQLVHVWTTDDNYSHGFLVPLISLYFANEAARRGPVPVRAGVATGVAMLLLALAGRMATIPVPVGIIGDLAFLSGLAGIVALLAGSAALRRYAFALGFLIFMVPLPVAVYAMIASPLQLMVSQIASTLLNATGVPVLCEGNLMTLPGGVRMFVAEACSGMRQLTGFLALTTAVAYLTERPAWHRALLVASAVPVAMTANVARVTLTGWIMSYDPKYAAGTFHTIEGLLMMGLGLSLLAAECWALNRLAEFAAKPARPAPTLCLPEGAR